MRYKLSQFTCSHILSVFLISVPLRMLQILSCSCVLLLLSRATGLSDSHQPSNYLCFFRLVSSHFNIGELPSERPSGDLTAVENVLKTDNWRLWRFGLEGVIASEVINMQCFQYAVNWFKPSKGVLQVYVPYCHGAVPVYLIDCNIIEQNLTRSK